MFMGAAPVVGVYGGNGQQATDRRREQAGVRVLQGLRRRRPTAPSMNRRAFHCVGGRGLHEVHRAGVRRAQRIVQGQRGRLVEGVRIGGIEDRDRAAARHSPAG